MAITTDQLLQELRRTNDAVSVLQTKIEAIASILESFSTITQADLLDILNEVRRQDAVPDNIQR